MGFGVSKDYISSPSYVWMDGSKRYRWTVSLTARVHEKREELRKKSFLRLANVGPVPISTFLTGIWVAGSTARGGSQGTEGTKGQKELKDHKELNELKELKGLKDRKEHMDHKGLKEHRELKENSRKTDREEELVVREMFKNLVKTCVIWL